MKNRHSYGITLIVLLYLTIIPIFSTTDNYGKIAFASKRDGNFEIYVMDADGSNQRRLTDNSAFDTSPAWSPDGTRIAFSSDRDGNFEIYVMDADGSNQRRLTNNSANDTSPAWSPDGIRIAFYSKRDGNYEIYVMDADGSNQRNITHNSESDTFPAWSPDNTKIVFDSGRDEPFGISEIYVMDADGSNLSRLTNNSTLDLWPAWSPDGTRIAFSSDRDGNDEIYVMDADGSNQHRLTNNSDLDWNPTWSPDSTKIAFHSNRDGNSDIYVMNADGSNQHRLTTNYATDWEPAWCCRIHLVEKEETEGEKTGPPSTESTSMLRLSIIGILITLLASLVAFFGISFEKLKKWFSKENSESQSALRHSEKGEEHFEFDIAISFAGEDREIAEKLVKALQAEGVKVFYDELYKHDFWGKDLREFFQGIYGPKTRFVLLLISKHYPIKDWTDFEFSIMRDEAKRRENEFILPIKLDDTKMVGIRDSIAYLDYRKEGIDGIVDCLLKKFNI